jgi:hypothetical protein
VVPTTEACNGVDDDCNPATADGSAEGGFGSACDGGDADTCVEGVMACNGIAVVCNDVSPDSNVVLDTGFEAGTPGPWTQLSDEFGTPLCDSLCGTGGGTGPHAGSWWAWFGGTLNATTDIVSESRTIPSGTASLTFFLEIPACASNGTAETFVVSIDGTPVFSTNNSDPACNTVGYQLKTVAIPAGFANGASHTLEFRGTFNATNSDYTNFFVDDVRLVSCP